MIKDKIAKEVDEHGNIFFHKNGALDRGEDKPAVILADKTALWYKNGKLGRDADEPSIICPLVCLAWYKNSKLHRDNDKPAVIFLDGTQAWYKNGKLGRDDGKPSMVYTDGFENEHEEWWDGSELTKTSRKGEENKTEDKYTHKKDDNGNICYYRNGELINDGNRYTYYLNACWVVFYYRNGEFIRRESVIHELLDMYEKYANCAERRLGWT